MKFQRRFPQGAEGVPAGGVHFRVWSPRSKTLYVQLGKTSQDVESGSQAVSTILKSRIGSVNQRAAGILPAEPSSNSAGKMPAARCGSWAIELQPEANGYFSGHVSEARAGMFYKYRLDSGVFPDPASRFQPDGPHGASQIVDATEFRWTDAKWKGVSREGQVIYEMHIGTFTRAGTWRAAAEQLPELARIGITIIEVMPSADFPGEFGWGYDGVNLYAPARLYGRPDDFRAFVDRAHALGVGVILDVVYNHFGPDGNYITQFSSDYFTHRHWHEWGDAINFYGENSGPVREFFIANADYWIEEFHLDGLRFDATQAIFDCSEKNILAEIVQRVREAARGRGTFIVAENEPQCTQLVRPPERGGFGMDALWNDDFHHTAMVRLTGRSEAYYTDYKGSPQEFISAAKWGYLYQGQRYKWQKARRGTPALDLQPSNFVNFIQNHDQVANSLRGLRLHEVSSPGSFRAMTALLLLGPATPMLFQGQEFASSAPFLYFADHHPELAKLVEKGRKKFLSQFASIARLGPKARVPNPGAKETFLRCKLDFSERKKHSAVYALHCDLLKLRREEKVFSSAKRGSFDGAVLGHNAFVLRFFGERDDDRLLLVNFGAELHLDPAPEPLLAPVAGCEWKTKWSSEDPRYDGGGTPKLDTKQNWKIPGQCAVVLAPRPLKS